MQTAGVGLAADLRVTTRNARFQQWQALLGNRARRQRGGEFLVQGVRPITMAVRHGWRIRALLYDADAALSGWARQVLDAVDTTRVAMAPDLMHELGGKTDDTPQLLAVVAVPDDDLTQPAVVVVGNETTGLSTAWRSACQHLVRIPMAGAASSLNAATAASIVLYESMRQRTASRKA